MIQSDCFKCFVCFETEEKEEAMITCGYHEVHIKCLRNSLSKNLGQVFCYTTCMICQKRIQKDQLEKTLKIDMSLGPNLSTIIKTDNLNGFIDYLSSNDLMVYECICSLVKNSIDEESVEILKFLLQFNTRQNDLMPLRAHLFKYPSHLGYCCLLEDMKLRPEDTQSCSIIDLLIERKRFSVLYDILRSCFLEIEKEEQVKILSFLLNIRKKVHNMFSLDFFWELCDLYPEKSCYIYDELIIPSSIGITYEGKNSIKILKDL